MFNHAKMPLSSLLTLSSICFLCLRVGGLRPSVLLVPGSQCILFITPYYNSTRAN